MKPNKLTPLILAAAVVCAGHSQAVIVVNDIILIDFGKPAETTAGNWNNITRPDNENLFRTTIGTTVLEADLKRFSDNAGTGVGLSVTHTVGGNHSGIGALTVTPGSVSFTGSGSIPNNAQSDVAFITSNGVNFAFTGLDDMLTYNVELLSRVGPARVARDVTIGGVTINIDPNDGAVHAFNNLTPTSGTLTISFAGNIGTGEESFQINALQLTAVPEPTTALLPECLDRISGYLRIGSRRCRARVPCVRREAVGRMLRACAAR